MTTEQLLLTAVSAVTGALCFVARLLWARSELCERDRYELREEIEALKEAKGLADGTLKAFERCPSLNCPFKPQVLNQPSTIGGQMQPMQQPLPHQP
jgi:hypothetical protein